MPPLEDATPIDALGDQPLSSLSDADFAKEFGMADPTGAPPHQPLLTLEDATEGMGLDANREDADAGEDDAAGDDGDAGDQDPGLADDDGDVDGLDDGEGGEAAPSGRKLATQFLAEDADGDEVDTTGVEITFMANHEATTLPLDRVVRLAQMGRYNESLQQEVKETRSEFVSMQARIEELEQLADQRAAVARKLLENDEYLLEQRERYAQANSPEERASRAEARLRAIAAERETSTFTQQVETFVDTTLYPAFDALQQAYPTVSAEELWGRFTIATSHMSRNGVIPPKHWADAMKVVERDLGPYAAQLHDRRSERDATTRAVESTAVRKAQEEATRAKKIVASAIRPAGTGTLSTPKRKAIVSSDDAVDDIIGGDVFNLVKSMRG